MRRLLAVVTFMLLASTASAQIGAWWPQQFHVFWPSRWFDTRQGLCICEWPIGSICPTGPLADQEYRHYQFQNQFFHGEEVPLGAVTAVVNVTVTGATGAGWLVLYRGEPYVGGPMPHPDSVTITFAAGETTSNLAFIKLGDLQAQTPLGEFYPDVLAYTRIPGGGTVHLIVDVLGYFK